ncbi:UDP-N-acetylmuramoyl-L-alanine--D-glutamate ligase [Prolixibacteraceae bacterium JC049]|nr:UDP-N-acetylmuramoyl-L-alanine--D-glutamate ligase [Prolixibacteraceae bacterium JC049]
MSRRIVILGAGESGVGSAILAQKQGFDVFVSDMGAIKEKYRNELQNYGIQFEEKQHTEELILNADEVIKSPGIPEKAPLIQQLFQKDIPVISEIEFAGRYTNAFTICITGSNGKTTTTMLTYELLKRAGLNVGLAGNVGFSFARQVAEENFDYYVLELSSFQLDGMFQFKADVAVLMNITPDHLDRYEYKMENYIDSKFRIAQNQDKGDYFVWCADDPILNEALKTRSVNSTMLPFGFEKVAEEGAYVEDTEIYMNVNQKELSMSMIDLALQGKHNVYNSMAAGIAAKVVKIRNEKIRECLTSFQGVEHRLERYLKVHGIEFINDSKATNVNSTWYALESMHKPVVWIAGGVDKGNDYSELMPLVKEKVKVLICLGTDNAKLIEAFGKVVPTVVETQSMSEAVKNSYFLGKKGDVVLLSPACASFDLFNNYEERGAQFKKAVKEL